MFQKIRYRLFLSNLLVFALVLTGSAFVVRFVFVSNLKQQLTERLIAVAQGTAASAELENEYLDWETEFSPQQLRERQQAFQWFDSQGSLLEQQGDHPHIPTLPFAGDRIVLTQTDKIKLQIVTLPIFESDSEHPIGYIRVSQSLVQMDETIARLDWGLTVGALVALILSSVGSGWLNTQAMQPIEESFARLKQFTGDASHELRSPLMVISTNAEVALTYAEGMRTSDREKFRAIFSASEQMSQLTEDLLLLARTDRVADFELKKINLATLLINLANLYQSQAQVRQIDLITEIETDLWLMGDEIKLTRAFSNLIQNAIHYTPPQGQVKIIGDRSERELKIMVLDTGIGIKKEHLDSIFERFWRADRSRSYYEGGSGLGLAITRAIVHNHQGTINVTSQLDMGSCFAVCFPALVSDRQSQI